MYESCYRPDRSCFLCDVCKGRREPALIVFLIKAMPHAGKWHLGSSSIHSSFSYFLPSRMTNSTHTSTSSFIPSPLLSLMTSSFYCQNNIQRQLGSFSVPLPRDVNYLAPPKTQIWKLYLIEFSEFYFLCYKCLDFICAEQQADNSNDSFFFTSTVINFSYSKFMAVFLPHTIIRKWENKVK